MTSITKQVWEIINEDPSIRRDLARGIINVSGLAAYLKHEHDIPGSPDSIISAIRRYNNDADIQNERAQVRAALAAATVTTKTRLTAIHLKNSSNLYKSIGELLRDPEFYKSEFFRLIKNRNETLVLIDHESIRRAQSFFPEGNIERIDERLALLSLNLTHEGFISRGVLARLTNEIAHHGVSIAFVLSSEPDVHLFVSEEDLPRAHEAVLSLTRR